MLPAEYDITGKVVFITGAGGRLKELNPDIRVVQRLFDPDLAARVERAFGIHISRSPSALAAPAFAAGATSNNPHYGAVHNPWALEHIPGGSSGGGGANVAACVTFASLGTDLGGAGRLPRCGAGGRAVAGGWD